MQIPQNLTDSPSATHRSPFAYIWHFIFVLTGLLILVLIAPHESPWQMKYIQSSLGDKTVVHVKFLSSEFVFSVSALAKSLALLFAGMFIVTPSARRCLKSLFKQPRRLIFLLLSLGYLLFTLKPTPNGWRIVLYLTLGTLGLTMTLIGISPLLNVLLSLSRLQSLGQRMERWFHKIPAVLLLLLLFALVFTATNLASYFLFERIPHIQDSIDQVFHGKMFLLGKLTVPSPEPREFFNFTHMINNGKWYSEYPPGHSLLMSFGHILHAPWLINPLFGALCVVLLYFVGKEMYSERIGRLAALLGTLSPFLIFMSSEFMNHTTTLFFVELFLLGFARMINRRMAQDALLTGFALGYALNIRPMTAVAIGAPFALYALFKLIQLAIMSSNVITNQSRNNVIAKNRVTKQSQRSEKKAKQKEALRFGMLCCVALAVFGVMLGGLLTFNYLTNGDAFLFAYVVLHGEEHNPGFGHSGWGEPHTPQRGLIKTLNNLNALNKYLFEIPIPSLLFAVLALASPRANIWDLLFISYPSSLALAYFFYWFQDWCFGPRFMFASTAAFVLLTARGLAALPHIAHHLFGITDKYRVRGYIAIVLILCFSIGFASNLPALVKVYSNNYWGVNAQVLKAVKNNGIQNAVVFVKSYYGSVFAANHPLLKSDVIYVKDLGAKKNAELINRFPDRQFYIANGASILPYP